MNQTDSTPPAAGPIARLSAATTAFAERWIPDAFVFALVATGLVVAAALWAGHPADEVIDLWGGGFWDLIPFTMQMALIVISGYVLATAAPIERAIGRLAALPRTDRGAVAWIALFAMISSWFNWGFSLVFSAMLAKEVARRRPTLDYRAACASTFLGLGSVWAQGLSGSAALQMATPSALPAAIRSIVAGNGTVPDGVLPLAHTIFLWQSLASVIVEICVVTAIMYWATPDAGRSVPAAALGIDLGMASDPDPERRGVPGEAPEHWRWLIGIFVALAGAYLVRQVLNAPNVIAAINLNFINLAFLTVGAALHGTPSRLMRAVREATSGVWGIILQFPFYAGIAAVIAKTELNRAIADFFVGISTPLTFPPLIAAYSALLGIFVPSGGSKWVIEAPYVMQAAHELKVHLGWMVAVYDLGEALANLVQPFWMLPVLGIFGLKARDVMGYTFTVFLVLFPLVLIMVTLFGATLSYPF